jgi:hypothetical protein
MMAPTMPILATIDKPEDRVSNAFGRDATGAIAARRRAGVFSC